MSKVRTYLDWNASAQIYPEVVDVMTDALQAGGNASSVHAEGRQAHNRIEMARDQVAALVNAGARDVIFTSGGSEANALALSGLAANGTVSRFLVSGTEHPSLLASAEVEGTQCTLIAVDGNGVIDLEDLEIELTKAKAQNQNVLVSIMWANNETGVLQPIERTVKLAHSKGALVHCDAVQAAGKVPMDFNNSGVDLLSLSAHKIGGPQGVGALIVRPGLALAPMVKGGGQELSRRAGTENLSGIVGFGRAAQICKAADSGDRILQLKIDLENKIKALRGDITIFSESCKRLPNTSCIALAGIPAETLLISLDLAGIAVSSGSACSSGKVAKSHVLAAMGIDEALARAAIRISLGWATTQADIDNFIENWAKAVGAAAKVDAIAAA